MSGRFTGMRHVRIKQDLMTKTSKLVRAGVMEEPGWMKVFKKMPPQVPPARDKAGVPKIVLPTDRLFRIRESKEKTTMPMYAHGELQSSTLLFAQRQWELINKGIPEQEAYKQVEEAQIAMRAEALAQVTALTASAKEEGATIPMLLGGKATSHVEGSSAMEQYSVWQKRIADTPYKDWELGQQVMLDHWICKTALAWGWEEERYLFDEDFEVELCKLRVALFPELTEEDSLTVAERAALHSNDDEEELDDIMDAVDWNDAGMNEKMNAWYITYGKWQTRSFVHPDMSKWDASQLQEFDQWITSKCLRPSALVGLSEEEIKELVVAERYSLFPRLNPEVAEDAPTHDVLPPLNHVRKLVLANMKMNEVPLEFPDQMEDEDDDEADFEDDFGEDFEELTGTAPEDLPYESARGGDAMRSLQEKGRGSVDEVDEEEYEYEEGEASPEADEFDELQRQIEDKEKNLVDQARREELWVLREAELEKTMEEVEEVKEIELKMKALQYALPELASFNTKSFRDSLVNKQQKKQKKQGPAQKFEK